MTQNGSFVWYEYMAGDVARAAAFYSDVVGWRTDEHKMPGGVYTVFSAGERGVGGLMELPEAVRESGGRPGWIGYVLVDDVDRQAAKAVSLGGTIHRPADDIPGIGRFAVIADPHGAVLVLFRDTSGMEQPPAPPMTAGTVGWHELYAGEWQSAFDFYQQMFGWEKTDAMDMGPMGTYQLFGLGGQSFGGMMTKPDAVPAPAWLYYFAVEGLDAAQRRVEAGGGQVLNGPMEVPGGAWIIQCADPDGAAFALVSCPR